TSRTSWRQRKRRSFRSTQTHKEPICIRKFVPSLTSPILRYPSETCTRQSKWTIAIPLPAPLPLLLPSPPYYHLLNPANSQLTRCFHHHRLLTLKPQMSLLAK